MTNLEIEEEWEKVKANLIAVAKGEWWASDEDYIKAFIYKVLQQRMDEIEWEVNRKIQNVETTELSTQAGELIKVAVIEAFKEVLNIIKSVDKNK